MKTIALGVIVLMSLISGCQDVPFFAASEGGAVVAPPPLDRTEPARIETATFALG